MPRRRCELHGQGVIKLEMKFSAGALVGTGEDAAGAATNRSS